MDAATQAEIRGDAVSAAHTGRSEPRRTLTGRERALWQETYRQEQNRRVTAALQEARR
jgi:hypothetical protein